MISQKLTDDYIEVAEKVFVLNLDCFRPIRGSIWTILADFLLALSESWTLSDSFS